MYRNYQLNRDKHNNNNNNNSNNNNNNNNNNNDDNIDFNNNISKHYRKIIKRHILFSLF